MKSRKKDSYSYEIVEENTKAKRLSMEQLAPFFADEASSNKSIAIELGVSESTISRKRKQWVAAQLEQPKEVLAVAEVSVEKVERLRASEVYSDADQRVLSREEIEQKMQAIFQRQLEREQLKANNGVLKEQVKERHLRQVLSENFDWDLSAPGQLAYLGSLLNNG